MGTATVVKTIVKKDKSHAGLYKQQFLFVVQIRHCTVLCSSIKVAELQKLKTFAKIESTSLV